LQLEHLASLWLSTRPPDYNLPHTGKGQLAGTHLPKSFATFKRQGYHDGIEGARKDYDNHRRPDVNNRDEYRHPHVPASARDDYREGFRRGYEAAMAHLSVGPR
jgi:hypothetical protein